MIPLYDIPPVYKTTCLSFIFVYYNMLFIV